jgi:hypothetical protein
MSDHHTPVDPRRAHHDVGGLSGAAVEVTEHDYALWEKARRCDPGAVVEQGADDSRRDAKKHREPRP